MTDISDIFNMDIIPGHDTLLPHIVVAWPCFTPEQIFLFSTTRVIAVSEGNQ